MYGQLAIKLTTGLVTCVATSIQGVFLTVIVSLRVKLLA